jgi:uncharacterized protein (TIGR03086 family)
MDDSLLALHGAVATGEVPLTAGPVGPDVVASLRQTGCSLLGRWSALRGDQSISVGGRTLPASVVAVTGALEVAVHGWDVARACGVRAPLPPGLADELLRHARWLIAAEDRGVRFGWPVATPAGCPPGDRLLALTGRQPDWEP